LQSTDKSIQTKDRLAALRLIADCNVDKFELLNAGPSVLAIKTMDERLCRIETTETGQ
jgi:hypothetical protein